MLLEILAGSSLAILVVLVFWHFERRHRKAKEEDTIHILIRESHDKLHDL